MINQLIHNKSIHNQSINQSIHQLIRTQSINPQSINPPNSQSTNQSITVNIYTIQVGCNGSPSLSFVLVVVSDRQLLAYLLVLSSQLCHCLSFACLHHTFLSNTVQIRILRRLVCVRNTHTYTCVCARTHMHSDGLCVFPLWQIDGLQMGCGSA